ncbi:nucleotidyltransferase family protein [Emcibacter sp. SYSU 3D8]|uniref:nucleotidyltransferase domain-containing protein n=1 Tax=Emcibacter sp. SYSU 3D8 TaxID=3133969 RepID=UPI0031FF41FD
MTADPLLRALRDPASMTALTGADWTGLMQRARPRALLGKLAQGAADAGVTDALPAAVRRQFASAGRLCAYNDEHLKAEAFLVLHALRDAGSPVLFLKGAAYALLGLKLARGRVSSDIDVLVPRERLPAVELALDAAGWAGMKLDPYDQRYYREWMHELPPLQHRYRATVMDVHHTILPLTGRITPDAGALLRDALPVAVMGRTALVPRPDDMVIHAALHLFQDGDLAERLRDLLDLHELAAEFAAADAGFWNGLAERARLHQAGRPLFYAFHFARRLLGTPVPEEFLRTLSPRPAALALAVMDTLVPAALLPSHPDRVSTGAALARRMLFIRSHWLRMPPFLLARHLAIKGWGAVKGRLGFA